MAVVYCASHGEIWRTESTFEFSLDQCTIYSPVDYSPIHTNSRAIDIHRLPSNFYHPFVGDVVLYKDERFIVRYSTNNHPVKVVTIVNERVECTVDADKGLLTPVILRSKSRLEAAHDLHTRYVKNTCLGRPLRGSCLNSVVIDGKDGSYPIEIILEDVHNSLRRQPMTAPRIVVDEIKQAKTHTMAGLQQVDISYTTVPLKTDDQPKLSEAVLGFSDFNFNQNK